MNLESCSLFEYRDGLHLRDTVLWFDAPKPRQFCFISHALIPNAFCHKQTLSTGSTAELLWAMASAHGKGRRVHEPKALITPYNRTLSIGEMRLTLIPAGHLLGSASLFIEYRGQRILYAGHINPQHGVFCEKMEIRPCDLLILPCALSANRNFLFPPRDDTERALVRFVSQAFTEGVPPILFCSSLGEPQEVMRLMAREGIRVVAHREIFSACSVYTKHAPVSLNMSNVHQYSRRCDPKQREVLIWPIRLRWSPSLQRFPSARTAFLSDFSLYKGIRKELACDTSFALGTHADYSRLLEYVRTCAPKQVLVTGATSQDLVADLQALGMAISQIGPQEQLALF
ncbi:MAG: hypothetical protein V1754_13375 [Pseudomonadota bacterium]